MQQIYDFLRQIVGAHKRGVAPSEENAADVEIADREGGGRCRPRGAPFEVGLEYEAQGKDDVAKGHQLTGTTIDIVITEPHIAVQQHKGNQEINASSYEQHCVVKLVFHV